MSEYLWLMGNILNLARLAVAFDTKCTKLGFETIGHSTITWC